MQTVNTAAAHLIINRLVVVFILRSDQRFKACMVHLIAPRGGLPTPRPRIGRLRLDRYRPVNCEPRIRPPHRLPVLYAVKGNTECVEGVACVGCVGGEYHTRAKAGGDSSQNVPSEFPRGKLLTKEGHGRGSAHGLCVAHYCIVIGSIWDLYSMSYDR